MELHYQLLKLKIGDKVMVYLDKSARHFGMAIEETIIEK